MILNRDFYQLYGSGLPVFMVQGGKHQRPMFVYAARFLDGLVLKRLLLA